MNEQITEILNKARRIAAYGIREPGSRSYEVARFLSAEGFEIIPIGPHSACHHKAFPTLGSVPGPVDMIAVFSGSADKAMRDAVQWGVRLVWVQPGVKFAPISRVRVVHGRCLRREYLSRWPPVASLPINV
jgi:predicted CoA-binding protein